MSQERISHSPEQREVIPAREAQEHQERLREHHERSAERSREDSEHLEKAARHEAHLVAEQSEKIAAPEVEAKPRKRGAPTKRELGRSFDNSMAHIRQDMSAPARTFSKVIHAKPVEKTSEALGSTVARPNALLAGAFTALLLSTIVYVVARFYGYPLSGFESIGAFILGWIIGLLFDYARVSWTNKRSV